MAGLGARCAAILVTLAALMPALAVRASDESVDRATKLALALDAHPDHGASQFDHYCARCHGARAHGEAEHAIPALAGQRFTYLVRQLANFSGGERDSDAMHKVVSQPELKEPQTWVDIASYLDRVEPASEIHSGDGSHTGLGRGIFREQCASCHQADAHGDAKGFVPSLRNQNYPYLVNQLHKMGEGYRHNLDEDLVRFLQSFNDADIRATADYLSRLQGPGRAHPVMRDDGVVVD